MEVFSPLGTTLIDGGLEWNPRSVSSMSRQLLRTGKYLPKDTHLRILTDRFPHLTLIKYAINEYHDRISLRSTAAPQTALGPDTS